MSSANSFGDNPKPAIACSTNQRWPAVIRLIEAVLMVAGIALIGFALFARVEGYLASQAALRTFESEVFSSAAALAADSNQAPLPEPDFTGWDQDRVLAYQQPAPELAVPIAVLQIPKIHLVVPVFRGTGSLTLNHGAGLIAGTAQPGEDGNIGIAAHRDGFFRGLKDLAAGDTIELRTRQGKDVYKIDRLQVVSPREVSVLGPQREPSLTLVTCYPFHYVGSAPKRFVVTAHRTQHLPAGPPTSQSRLNS